MADGTRAGDPGPGTPPAGAGGGGVSGGHAAPGGGRAVGCLSEMGETGENCTISMQWMAWEVWQYFLGETPIGQLN